PPPEVRERVEEGRSAVPRVTDRPALGHGRGGGHRPGGGAGGAARGQSRPNAALSNSPGHRSEGRGAADTASLRSGLRRARSRGRGGRSSYRRTPESHPPAASAFLSAARESPLRSLEADTALVISSVTLGPAGLRALEPLAAFFGFLAAALAPGAETAGAATGAVSDIVPAFVHEPGEALGLEQVGGLLFIERSRAEPKTAVFIRISATDHPPVRSDVEKKDYCSPRLSFLSERQRLDWQKSESSLFKETLLQMIFPLPEHNKTCSSNQLGFLFHSNFLNITFSYCPVAGPYIGSNTKTGMS
ncbi:hypothetical protein DV515_00004645, partial [Chloebia gouldiae]